MGNITVWGLADVGDNLCAVLKEFRAALKAAAKRSAAAPGVGLHDLAMAVGRPALGGFAPVAGGAGRKAAQALKMPAPASAPGFSTPGHFACSPHSVGAVKPLVGEPSFRAVLAQARQQLEAVRARREAARKALHLPRGQGGLENISFAPRMQRSAPGGAAPNGGMPPGSLAPGLRQRASVHGAVAAAEAAVAGTAMAVDQRFAAAAARADAKMPLLDVEQALESYFFRQSRLPPAGGAGFNQMLSPLWAGLKIPG